MDCVCTVDARTNGTRIAFGKAQFKEIVKQITKYTKKVALKIETAPPEAE